MRPAASKVSFVFALPLAVVAAAVYVVPFVGAAILSLWDAGPGGVGEFTGLANFRRIALDTKLITSAVTSAKFIITAIVLELLVGAVLAGYLYWNRRHARFLVPLLLLPPALPPVVVGLAWTFFLDGRYGPAVIISSWLGAGMLTSPFADHRYALAAVVIMDVWQWTPLFAVALFAASIGLPRSTVEAAIVDGCSNFRTWWTLILPQIRVVIVGLLVIRYIDLTREMEKIFVATGGGPGLVTEVLSLRIWRLGFRYWQLGYASAVALTAYVIFAVAGSLLMVGFVGRHERS